MKPKWNEIRKDDMATITLKNIPDETYKDLKNLASKKRRSINSEVVYLIEKATASRKIDPQYILLEARSLREKTREYKLDERGIKDIKNEARP